MNYRDVSQTCLLVTVSLAFAALGQGCAFMQRHVCSCQGVEQKVETGQKTRANCDNGSPGPELVERDSSTTGDESASSSDSKRDDDGDATFRTVSRSGEQNDQGDAPEAEEALAQETDETASDASARNNNGNDDARDEQEEAPSDDSPSDSQHEEVDPSEDSALVSLDDEETRERIENTYDVELPESSKAVAITGTFSHGPDNSDQLAVVIPGASIRFYAAGKKLAELKFANDSTLPEEFRTIEPVRLVRDGTLQIKMHWAKEIESDDERVEYKVGIYKVIGSFVGRLFERTVATGVSDDSETERTGYVDVLRGDRHHFLRWTPAAEDGSRDTSESEILKWNKWEGVFRVPRVAPTAPENRS